MQFGTETFFRRFPLVISILATISSGILILFAGLSLHHNDCMALRLYFCTNLSYNICDVTYEKECLIQQTISCIQLATGILQFAMGVASAALSCRATCCHGKAVDGDVVFRVNKDNYNIPDILELADMSGKEGETSCGIDNENCASETESLPDSLMSFNYASF